jgi:ABC-type transporter Mla subunit MlaD
MSDTLEIAAREAVVKVQPLLAQLDEAAEDCRSALGYVGALRAQLEQDRKELEEAVAALASEADTIETELAEGVTLATSALGSFATGVRQAGVDGPADLDAETAALDQAGQLLTDLGPWVDEVGEAVEVARRAALEQAAAVAKSLGEAVDNIEETVGVELMFHVAELRQHLETAVGELIALLSEKCSQFLDEKEADWRQKLAAVRQLMDTSLDTTETHLKEVTAHTGEKWDRLLEQEMTEVEGEVTTLVNEVGSLTQAVANLEGQVTVAAEMVEQREQGAAEAAATLEGALTNVRGRWGTFGITC